MEASAPSNISIRSGVKPRKRGWKSVFEQHTFRRLSQSIFLLFIIFLAVQHVIVGEDSAVVTASPEAFCPFGGLETLYKYFTEGGAFVSHTHLSNVIVLIAVAVTAVFLRSAFCGWVCPLGTIQDFVSSLSRYLQKHNPGLRRAIARLKSRAGRLAVLDRYMRILKYLILVWAVVGSAYFGYMVFRDYDPWATLLNLAEFSFTPGLIVLLVMLLASFFVDRPWCRYACPLGAASGLLGKLSPIYLKREQDACKVCQVCTKACPMGLPVHSATTIKSADCMTCLECIGACPRKGALEVRLGLPLLSESLSQRFKTKS
jgi:NapH/MauN family ferredoxin-type protein